MGIGHQQSRDFLFLRSECALRVQKALDWGFLQISRREMRAMFLQHRDYVIVYYHVIIWSGAAGAVIAAVRLAIWVEAQY